MDYCTWRHTSSANEVYHDKEWGIPVYDDHRQFEYLCLEVLQCGLSWDLIIRKREVFRACLDQFDYHKIAQYTKEDVERIIQYPGMIKSPRKVQGLIKNAKAFLAVQAEFGSFHEYLWSYTSHQVLVYTSHHTEGIPASNELSTKISKDMKKRGFTFVGPVTIYSHLQAAGLINDHDSHCPQYEHIINQYPIQYIK